MISRYKALIFDMDGTLIDSMGLWRQQSLAFLQRHQLPIPEEMMGRELDVTSNDCAELFIRKYGLQTTVDEIIHEYERNMVRAYSEGVPEKPGALGFLEAAREKGYKMCVVTLTPQDNAELALRVRGMAHCFDFVLSAQKLQMSKRDPEIFERVAAMLGVPVDACLVFEDALYAMKSAKQAGCAVYAIQELTARRDIPEILRICDRYFETYDQLLTEL